MTDRNHTGALAQAALDFDPVKAKQAVELANKIDLHLTLSSASPGFHLSEDELQMAAAALRFAAQPPAAPVDLINRLRSMPSSLNDALRTMEEAADYLAVAPAAPVETKRTPLDLSTAELNQAATEAFREAAKQAAQLRSSAETGELRWQIASEKDCCDALYQIGGALRRVSKVHLAQEVERIADALYPGKIKPAPIVPRTTT